MIGRFNIHGCLEQCPVCKQGCTICYPCKQHLLVTQPTQDHTYNGSKCSLCENRVHTPTTKPLDEQIADIIVPHNQYIDAVWRGEHEMYAKPHTYEKIADLIAQEVKIAREPYNELIMAVGNKYEGETRHQTALRYIKEAENQPDQTAVELENN
jgi:hypothetical protein